MNRTALPDLLVILGPTATGKTRLAVQLADHLDGEVISADSRQVYKSLTIGTGKDLDEYCLPHQNIPYHLIDILNPNQDYSVFQFQRDFYQAFGHIAEVSKLPILCGGTGLYIESVLLGYEMCEVPADPELRAELAGKPLSELQDILLKLNPSPHNSSDLTNQKRLIRAIEIAKSNARPVPPPAEIKSPVVVGVHYPRNVVRDRISKRLSERLNEGLIEEVEGLLRTGLTHDRLEYFGLEYRYISRFLSGQLSWNDMVQKLTTAIRQFSKRQMTFFRHMERKGIKIHWVPNGSFETVLEILSGSHFHSEKSSGTPEV